MNGTVEIKYRNGTHIRREKYENGTFSIYFIRRPEGYAQEGTQNQAATITFNNGTQRSYFPAVPADASEYDKAVAPEYQDTLADGSFIITFVNGSVAEFYPSG